MKIQNHQCFIYRLFPERKKARICIFSHMRIIYNIVILYYTVNKFEIYGTRAAFSLIPDIAA